ncbi:capsular biosynthesis protein [Thalassotalea sp. Y01]|uniref:capsular biosynthesis protein n=1 Tax=Thalassotalea sp. Y01 TaxID=2729613 RepID=UPI00145C81E7|nr:capsular biosynthesis protein [Thalassotalea sp. Y01]NMP14982.1 capsular biosynthesis protein [Thalassotalea sp. Y01]
MIIIPMAGLSSRFTKAGFKKPKYMLEAKGATLFEHSVKSFETYFTQEKFLFIALDVQNTKGFIIDNCQKLGILDFDVVILDEPTRGQAETVYLGLQKASCNDDEHITIFNIDTFRPNFKYPNSFDFKNSDGYLETFIGSGANWSNVVPESAETQTVKLTAEKQELSEYCCTGLYYWKRAADFNRLYQKLQNTPISEVQGNEYYIAPMYNDIISEGKTINFSVIEENEVIFCGVPAEYYDFIENDISAELQQ